MNHRQRHILRVLSSICVAMMAFCVTMPVAILMAGILFNPPQGHAFFSPQEATLFLTSILVGLIVAVFVGIKYYLYQGG